MGADGSPADVDLEQWTAAERASLRRIAAAVVTGADPTAALNLAAREVAALMRAEQGFVFRFTEAEVVIAGAHGVEAAPVGAVHGMLPRGVIPLVFATGEPARVEGVLRPLGRENSSQYWISPVYRGGIGAPVFVGEELWGALVAATIREEAFPEGAEEHLAYFAEIAGIAIGNAEANSRLAQLAMSDPLTGLANHRTFHSALATEAERARRHGRPLALAVIDVDHFKAVNDLHGHMAGDRVLVEVARRLRAAARSGDVLARVGGEEFAWIIPEADTAGAHAVAERARCAVGDAAMPGVGAVTISIGVAELTRGGSVLDLYHRADEALYQAKRAGRNRTRIHDGMPPEVTPGAPVAPTAVVTRALLRAMGVRDPQARAHCERVAAIADRIAAQAGWSEHRRGRLVDAALVHDVGGTGAGSALAVLAADIAADALSPEQAGWIRGHRERWDGTGGPDRHAGTDIPEGARILAVADRWDALTAPLPAGEGLPPEAALAALRRDAGSRFCPDAVAALAAAPPAPAAAGA
ncbi:MAG TPA: diguanylate cyclase [Miltoncostaea sp.]|nr:diguanylate cyclase [Miltoncostaea sp.]